MKLAAQKTVIVWLEHIACKCLLIVNAERWDCEEARGDKKLRELSERVKN